MPLFCWNPSLCCSDPTSGEKGRRGAGPHLLCKLSSPRPENYARGNPRVVLPVVRAVVELRQHIVHLNQTDSHMGCDFGVETAAKRQGKRTTPANVRAAEKEVKVRRQFIAVAIGKFRAKEIGDRVNARTEDTPVVYPEVSDQPNPIARVDGDGTAGAIGTEPRAEYAGMQVRVPPEDLCLRVVLRRRGNGKSQNQPAQKC